MKLRLQKEEKVALILLSMALGSLAVAGWMLDGSPERKDTALALEGTVTEMRETATGGNLMIHIDSSDLTIFVPQSSGAGDVRLRVHQGDRIRAKGEPSEYQGNKELLVQRASDIEPVAGGVK